MAAKPTDFHAHVLDQFFARSMARCVEMPLLTRVGHFHAIVDRVRSASRIKGVVTSLHARNECGAAVLAIARIAVLESR